MPPERDYEVGYKKPPKHSRFKKGQSGDPAGRPRVGKDATTQLRAALDERVTVIENGRRVKISKLQAMLKQLANRAAQGDPRATQTVLRMQERDRQAELDRGLDNQPDANPQSRVVMVLPDNGRDPELTEVLIAAQAKAQEDYYREKSREQAAERC
jgi:hypothetical protein